MSRKFWMTFLGVGLGGLLLAPSVRAESSAESIVNLLLKKGLITQEEAASVLGEAEQEAAKLKKLPEKGTIVSGKSGKKHQISGYTQVDAHFGDSVLHSPDNTVEIRRARLALEGAIIDPLEYKVQIDAAASSSILRDAKLTYKLGEWAHLNAGQYKAPFSREVLNSSSKIETIERAQVSNAIGPERQIGGSVSGKLFEEFLSYEGGIFNGNGSNTKNDDDSFLYVGRVVLTPYKTDDLFGEKAKLEIAGNIGTSEDTDAPLSALGYKNFVGDRDIYGLDAKAEWGNLGVIGEFLHADLDFEGIPGKLADPVKFTAAVKAQPAADVESDGWYLTTYYYFIPKRLQFVTKWEEFDVDNKEDFEALTLGLNYYFTEWDGKAYPTRLMVNYVHGDQKGNEEEDQVLMRFQVGY